MLLLTPLETGVGQMLVRLVVVVVVLVLVLQWRLRLLLLLLLLQLWLHVGVACQQLPRVCTRTRLRPGGCACCLPAA